MDFLRSLEQTQFSIWIRDSGSIWTYPLVLYLHTMGMATVVGLNAAIDVRMMGFAPEISLATMKRFFPYMWAGFWLNAATGSILLFIDASTKLANPVFYVKMIFIALALVDLRMIRNQVFGDRALTSGTLPANAKVLAIASMVFWAGAVTAGRLMAYLGPVSGLSGLE